MKNNYMQTSPLSQNFTRCNFLGGGINSRV